MTHCSKQVMLPFAALPTTEGVRTAIANVIRDIQRDFDLTDLQLAAKIEVHVNTIQRARNKAATMDSETLNKLGAAFGPAAMQPIKALWGVGCQHDDCELPTAELSDAVSALTRAKGLKGELDALPTVKAAIAAAQAYVAALERKRLRVAA